jgi:hypothetical protein
MISKYLYPSSRLIAAFESGDKDLVFDYGDLYCVREYPSNYFPNYNMYFDYYIKYVKYRFYYPDNLGQSVARYFASGYCVKYGTSLIDLYLMNELCKTKHLFGRIHNLNDAIYCRRVNAHIGGSYYNQIEIDEYANIDFKKYFEDVDPECEQHKYNMKFWLYVLYGIENGCIKKRLYCSKFTTEKLTERTISIREKKVKSILINNVELFIVEYFKKYIKTKAPTYW